MPDIDLKTLLEAGCHFGHEVKRWHPKAAAYIYTSRDKIHIIDLAKTKDALLKACGYVKKLGEQGKILLFVGTKRQAKGIILSEAQRVKAPYFSQRWIGGFMTNWSEIKKNLDKLNSMTEDKKVGKWQKFTKHEQLTLDRERQKLEKSYGGVKHLTGLPDALFIVDVRKEGTVVAECLQKQIPIIGIVDTNSDPSKIDYPIPANDDAVKSIALVTKYIADSYEEGLNLSKKQPEKKNIPNEEKPVEGKTAEPVKEKEVKVTSSKKSTKRTRKTKEELTKVL